MIELELTARTTLSGTPKIAGMVLAGGRSLRLGRDKAAEPFHGALLIEWSLRALRPGVVRLAINGPAALAERLDLPQVSDYPTVSRGPLAGLLGGLIWARAAGCDYLLTAPCDTPFLPLSLCERLIGEIGDRPVAVARAVQVHPLCALWRTDAFDKLKPFGRSSRQPPLQRIIELMGGGFVQFADEAAFDNLNTEEAMDIARCRAIQIEALSESIRSVQV